MLMDMLVDNCASWMDTRLNSWHTGNVSVRRDSINLAREGYQSDKILSQLTEFRNLLFHVLFQLLCGSRDVFKGGI